MPDRLNKQEIAMLREEMEMLMGERAGLLKVVGAASRLGSRVEVLGGLVLIGIGLRLLYEHGVF